MFFYITYRVSRILWLAPCHGTTPLPREVPENLGAFDTVPYAIDRERNVILIFNQRNHLNNILKILNERSLLRVLTCTERILPQYKELYEYVNDRISENLKECNNPEEQIFNLSRWVGMSAYYQSLRCYRGLHNIDLDQLFNKE